jgi:tetratricopeptide (TPR) repeat protein
VAMSNALRAEELRKAALSKHRAGEIDESIAIYDQALALAEDDEQHELITINKADAMIQAERIGPEVQALPAIVMRRRKPHHTFLAAYSLVFKYRMSNELKRATFYGELALKTAEEADEPFWTGAALNELGSIYDTDSQFDKAIDCFDRAVKLIERLEDASAHDASYGTALENLGAAKISNGDYAEGVEIIERGLDYIVAPSYRAEAFIDLCYGYLAIENLEKARLYGDAGLELAAEPRQIRNVHYLLGEVYYKLDDLDRAEFHFDELCRFYPEFRNLKSLLFAIDLRSMVNLKL